MYICVCGWQLLRWSASVGATAHGVYNVSKAAVSGPASWSCGSPCSVWCDVHRPVCQSRQRPQRESHCHYQSTYFSTHLPSVLWHCWFGVRKSIRPVKIEWWDVGVVIFLQRGADCLHMVHRLLPRLYPQWFYLSVLWRCWLGGRKGIRPVKNWVVGCWHGYLYGAMCKLAYGPADATATHCLLLQ